MDIQDDDMKIRELFRHKLENAEIIPDPSVGVNLMKRVGRQEFLRFDPSRFNVYYLGAVFVAGITAGIVFFSGGTETAQVTPPEQITMPVDSPVIESIAPAEIQTADAVLENKETDLSNSAVNADTGNSEANKIAAVSKPARKDTSLTDSVIETVKEAEAAKPKNTEKVIEYSKYQDGFRTVVPKMNYTKRTTPPAKEKVVINPVVIEDSVLTKEIMDITHPGQDVLKAEADKLKPVARASATEGCPPLKVEFKNESGAASSSKWVFEDSVVSGDNNPTWIFRNEGEYLVKLQDETGAPGTGILVTVYPEPTAVFETEEGELHPGDEVSFYNKSLNAVAYSWDFGDGTRSELVDPVHKFKKAGSYNVRLIVTSDFGCTDTATMVKVILRGREE